MTTRNKIYGAPGTGKTTKLIKLILDSGIPLEKIAYCTFSKRALDDFKKRMTALDVSDFDMTHFRTLHSMNFMLLGMKKDNVVTDGRLQEFCKQYGFRLTDHSSYNADEPLYTNPNVHFKKVSLDDEFYKQMMQDRNELRPFSFVHPRLAPYAGAYLHFKHKYFDWLRDNDYIDFIGMVEQGIERGVVPPVEMLCVDEWQDLNPLQIKQITKWAENIPISYHCGDDDQTIYSFSGADPLAFLNMPCDTEEVLGETFRLPSDILSLSMEVIRRNKVRKDKDITTTKADGGIYVKSLGNAVAMLKDHIPKTDSCFVLCRNNFVIRKMIKDLASYGIPVGGLKSERDAVELMLEGYKKGRFEHKELNVITSGSLFPALRYFKRGSKAKLKKIASQGTPEGGYTMAQIANFGLTKEFFTDLAQKNCSHLNIDKDDLKYILKIFSTFGYQFNPVQVMTIHQSKGLEADTVILVPDIVQVCSDSENGIGGPQQLESERRVWYTAITRARKRLIMLSGTDYSKNKSRIFNFVSVFVDRMKREQAPS